MSLNVPCFRIAVLPGDGIGTEIMAACTQAVSYTHLRAHETDS